MSEQIYYISDYHFFHEVSFNRSRNKYFDSIETVDEAKLIKDQGKWVQLFHYPILRWYRKNKGAYHIYGHIHDEQKGKEVAWLKQEDFALNACVEVNDFETCTLQELIMNNQEFKEM